MITVGEPAVQVLVLEAGWITEQQEIHVVPKFLPGYGAAAAITVTYMRPWESEACARRAMHAR